MRNERGEYVSPFGNALVEPLRYPRLYSTKQTPRGSVVVLGDRIISEHEIPTAIAQQTADWLNHSRKSAR
jgi:hypothetical protein